MEMLKSIGLGLGLLVAGLSLVIGITWVLMLLGRLVLGPGYEAAGPAAVLALFTSWLIGSTYRDLTGRGG